MNHALLLEYAQTCLILILRLSLIPLGVMTLLFTLAPGLTGSTSMMIIPAGALAIGLSWLSYRKARKEEKA